MSHTRFTPPHLLREYLGKPGHEMNGMALSPMALDALAEGTTNGTSPLVVIGRFDLGDKFYLELGVPTGYIEATSDFRYDADRKKLRLLCPDCGLRDGKHMKTCGAA